MLLFSIGHTFIRVHEFQLSNLQICNIILASLISDQVPCIFYNVIKIRYSYAHGGLFLVLESVTDC